MKNVIKTAIAATVISASAAFAGPCDVVDNINKEDFSTNMAVFGGAYIGVITLNPLAGVVGGVWLGGGSYVALHGIDGGCYLVDNAPEAAEYVADKAEVAYDYSKEKAVEAYDVVTSYDYSSKKDELVAMAKDIDYKFWN